MDNVKLLHFIVVALSDWVNRHQQAIIDYLIEENRIFKQQLQGRGLRLPDNDRRRLAAKAKVLGRSVLDEIDNLVTPDTLRAWHRKLIARKWTYARKGPGRPSITKEIADLLLHMPREKTSRGYDRLRGAYEKHYLRERNHQGVGNELPEPTNVVAFSKEPVQLRERLGGLLSYYHREAA
jgi:hypothetical protein